MLSSNQRLSKYEITKRSKLASVDSVYCPAVGPMTSESFSKSLSKTPAAPQAEATAHRGHTIRGEEGCG
jgi:hypothetical protein